VRYATPRKCPVPGCEHAPMTNPGGYLTHVMGAVKNVSGTEVENEHANGSGIDRD
jgi:hypothetical protein